ncbi:hypothetical protein F3Y22_tig00110956pilonHSYRG00007 [Hibiscus syriacus]|uniref:Uncharacterized protein n=1 Tax=Hibiscus syriacus TaxID=106335 RepID=A0A6A2ZCB0_HIBSY|nr:uncharacterized protein LOC120148417 [Hibiscus syriacus]KAE8688682.1 hypothetical protein F3Y22_tig00110956pilonHSYRG00007 [Hibiscus syriacus]
MEECKKQVIGMEKSKEGKPPTRLQMHAPASLQLDQVEANFGTAKAAAAASAATPIPLLTPLASPNLFPQTDDFMFPIDDSHRKAAAIPVPTVFAWKEPAGAAHVEVSALFALFQNRCVLVNDAQ